MVRMDNDTVPMAAMLGPSLPTDRSSPGHSFIVNKQPSPHSWWANLSFILLLAQIKAHSYVWLSIPLYCFSIASLTVFSSYSHDLIVLSQLLIKLLVNQLVLLYNNYTSGGTYENYTI